MIGKHVIVRTRSAGVFAGILTAKSETEVTVKDARRLWYWSGAASLSQLAMEGVKHPNDCKFPCEVSEVVLAEWIEILPTTEAAQASIKSVPIWKQ